MGFNMLLTSFIIILRNQLIQINLYQYSKKQLRRIITIYLQPLNSFQYTHYRCCRMPYNFLQIMQGGVFGLTKTQKGFLYLTQLVPTIITIFFPNIIKILLLTQIFYLLSIYIYVKHLSLQKSFYPYYASERTNLKSQIKKGRELAISAFLLITIYGIMIIKIGKITLPLFINLGVQAHQHYWISILLTLINPFTQQLYWRLFLQKSLQKHYEKEHITNVCYLVFHFTLFSTFLGFWGAQPFVLTFYSIGRSMKHIKNKYGIVASIMTHYGITLAGYALLMYLRQFTKVQI